MLVTSKQMIQDAQKGKYAIGSFNTSDLEITKAIIAAAENKNSPVIIETSEKAIAYAGLEELAELIKQAAEKAKVPVALHLDHGQTLQTVTHCLKNGYTSIMFDGSHKGLPENIILTRQAAEACHRKDIPCEGELGAVRKTGEEKTFTDPDEVYEFVKKTKVDYLAVAIGSSHGVSDDEKLNIDLLKDIKIETKIPLVLHGASGVSEEDIKKAIKNGICKINIDTDIRHTFARAVRDLSKDKSLDDPRDMMTVVMEKIQKLVESKIEIFGSEGKAK